MQLLLATGYWPPDIPFDTDTLVTVFDEMDLQAKEANR